MFKYKTIWKDSTEAHKTKKLESDAQYLALGPYTL